MDPYLDIDPEDPAGCSACTLCNVCWGCWAWYLPTTIHFTSAAGIYRDAGISELEPR